MLSENVQWCLQKALERTLAGDKEGSLEYLDLAKLWYKRELGTT